MARSKSKLNSEECKQSIINFFQKKKRFEQIQSRFSEIKTDFYNDMEDYFKQNDIDGKLTIENGELDNVESFVVTRIQSSKVEFNPDKLERVLGKELSRDVIQKHYEIVDMAGLISYLQGYGVNPKVFKSFISVRKSVNTRELDRLESLGKITTEQIKGCYIVRSQNPYFTVNVGKGQDNGST
jgi:hypothetical protein